MHKYAKKFEILVQEIIYSYYKSLEAKYAVFPLNNSERGVRVGRVRTRTEPAYHKYHKRKDRLTYSVIGLWQDLRAIGPAKDYFNFLLRYDRSLAWQNRNGKTPQSTGIMLRYVISTRLLHFPLPDFQSCSRVNSALTNNYNF